jgi:hypothetical protein
LFKIKNLTFSAKSFALTISPRSQNVPMII